MHYEYSNTTQLQFANRFRDSDKKYIFYTYMLDSTLRYSEGFMPRERYYKTSTVYMTTFKLSAFIYLNTLTNFCLPI
jgi:hypothetical protein